MYPLLYWLELFTDFVCLERGSFDIAYLSELDPLALDDDLSAIIHPEAFLYNNIVAQSACAADCLSANTGLARDELHWCSGCQGSMYPMNNNINGHIGGVQASTNVVERLLYKLHRTGVADETAGTSMRDIKINNYYVNPRTKGFIEDESLKLILAEDAKKAKDHRIEIEKIIAERNKDKTHNTGSNTETKQQENTGPKF